MMSKRRITGKRDKVVSTTTCNGVTVARTETETRIIMLSFVGTIVYAICLLTGVFK